MIDRNAIAAILDAGALTLPVPRRLYAWWYFTIALGFLLLAINRMLFGEKAWLIVLRVVIAAGFAALGYMELRTHSRTK